MASITFASSSFRLVVRDLYALQVAGCSPGMGPEAAHHQSYPLDKADRERGLGIRVSDTQPDGHVDRRGNLREVPKEMNHEGEPRFTKCPLSMQYLKP